MPRIPLVEPQNMNEAQANHYEAGPGGKLAIYRLLCNAPSCQVGYRMLAQAIFSQLDIPATEREMVVLVVAHLEQCGYEWAQHVQIALDIGISQAQIEAIATGHFDSEIFNDREKALFEFTRQTVKNVRVDDRAFRNVSAFYSPRQQVELLFTIGSYMMLGRIMEVAQLEVDDVQGASVVRHAIESSKTGKTID